MPVQALSAGGFVNPYREPDRIQYEYRIVADEGEKWSTFEMRLNKAGSEGFRVIKYHRNGIYDIALMERVS